MDAFESLIETLLKKQGYWTRTSFKVDLTKSDKQAIDKPASPRWELDVVAYKGAENEILAVECKSYLDSTGVQFRNGEFHSPSRYKLFNYPDVRRVVLNRLKRQLVKQKAVGKNPRVTLCLAAGHIASNTDREALKKHMDRNRWLLFDEQWVVDQLRKAADTGYENDVAHIVAKIFIRNTKQTL